MSIGLIITISTQNRVQNSTFWALIRSLYNIGPCCHVIAHVVFWLELPVQRRLSPLFVKSWVPKKKKNKGLNGVLSGYLTSMNLPRVDGLSTDPRFGASQLLPETSFFFFFTISCNSVTLSD